MPDRINSRHAREKLESPEPSLCECKGRPEWSSDRVHAWTCQECRCVWTPGVRGWVVRGRRAPALPSPAKVNHELEKIAMDARNLLTLVDDLRKVYEEAYDASLSQTSSGDIPTLGRGFEASDPTGNTATNGRLPQLRYRATKAARKVAHAASDLLQAVDDIGTGFGLAFDDQDWMAWVASVQKRLAATEGR